MAERVATCIWPVTSELLLALDERLGDPDDSYLNGAQVWLRDNGPGDARLEWRLHPVPGFARPPGLGVHDVWDAVVYALRMGETPPAPPAGLWEGLEAFPGFGDELEPAPLAAACSAVLGIAPEAFGVVDHDVVADAWERAEGRVSILGALRWQLGVAT